MDYVDDLLSFMRYEADHYPLSGYKLFEDSPKVKNGSIMSVRHIYSTLLAVYSHYFFSNIHIMETLYNIKNDKKFFISGAGLLLFSEKTIKKVLNVKDNEELKTKMKHEIEKISECLLISLNAKLLKKTKHNVEIEEEIKYLINYIDNMNDELTHNIYESIFEHVNSFISEKREKNYYNSLGRDVFRTYDLRKIN